MGILTTVESGGTNLLLKYGIIVAIGFGGGWTVNGWRLNSALSDLKANDAKASAIVLQKQIDNDTRIATQYQSAAALANKQREDTQHALDTLNADLSAGRVGLRVSAHCSAKPAATASGSANAGTTDQATSGQTDSAYLNASAYPDYSALVVQIAATESHEAELIAALRAVYNFP